MTAGSKKIGSRNIKMYNRGLVYEFIRNQGPVSKQDIVAALRLSLPTVTQNLVFLEEQGLVDGSEQIRNTGGRNAAAFSVNASARYAIGISLTTHHMNAVAVNILGEAGSAVRRRIHFNLDSDAYLREIGEMVREIIDKDHIDPEKLLGVGISVPGLISEDGDKVVYGRTLQFTGKTLQEICRYIPYPASLFHDTYTAVIAEQKANPSLINAFYLMLSNTVGGASLVNGQLYEGDNRRAGDIPHLILEPHSERRCYCGNYGCTDIFLSANELDSYTGGNLADYFQLLRSGDEEAAARWKNYLTYLSLTIHNIRLLYDCEVILGGYVGAYLTDDDLAEVYIMVDAMDLFGCPSRDYVHICSSKIESIAVGAGQVIVERFLQSML